MRYIPATETTLIGPFTWLRHSIASGFTSNSAQSKITRLEISSYFKLTVGAWIHGDERKGALRKFEFYILLRQFHIGWWGCVEDVLLPNSLQTRC